MKNTEILTIDQEGIDDLIRIMKERGDEDDVVLIQLAYDYAVEAHGEQRRKSGNLYVVHPLATAIELARLGMDVETVAAGLLHDVPEDTEKTLEDIAEEFGEEIGFLVEGITKLGQLKYRGMERYVDNLRRMFMAMAQDARVIVIKFADRINNLRTLDSLPENKRRRIALESLEIFAPIANRLGMGEFKGRLEDLSFPHVYPEEYRWLTEQVLPKIEVKQEFIEQFDEWLNIELSTRKLEFIDIHSRKKHIYSLYQKLVRHNRDVSKIYDIVAVRIIMPNVAKCYEALGIVHEICKPLKGRIKDYISQPKPNGYQSLHTTVFSPRHLVDDESRGEIVEIQIRTPEMHEEAEFGIAAHWQYDVEKIEDVDHKVEWMQQIVDMQENSSDMNQVLESLKIDIFQNRIYVFTPRGDVIELPENATPVDFAYRIHSDVGHKCSGAKVNEQIVSLDTKLHSGDVIEVFTDPHRKGPSSDWLEFVKTNTARGHIREYVNRKNRDFVKGTDL